jgi:Ca2+-binding RTX toxin-like protein
MADVFVNDVTVANSQTLSYDNQSFGLSQPAITLQTRYGGASTQYPSPSLTNFGTISISATTKDFPYGAINIDSSYLPSPTTVLLNAPTGVIDINVSTASAYVIGMEAGAFAPFVDNRGLFQVTASGAASYAIGVHITDGGFGSDPNLTNSGHIAVSGAGQAVGVRIAYAGVIANSGLIEVHGGGGDYLFNGQGTMGAALAVALSAAHGGSTSLTNSGTVQASDTSAAINSVAVGFYYSGTLTNTGLIAGDYAVRDMSQGVQTIQNSGTLQGVVDLGVFGDILVNTGHIQGAVLLGDDDDIYNGVGGDAYSVSGGNGADLVVIGTPNGDVLDGGAGIDTVRFTGSAAGVAIDLGLTSPQNAGPGLVTLSGFENLAGSAFADTLTGDGANNVIDGGGGADALDGGGGVNTVSFASASAGVSVSLALQGSVQATGAGSDTLSNFQNLAGSAYDDALTGDAGANVISGGAGNDVIDGHGGADTLDGGTGVNTVSFAAAGSGVTVRLALQGSAQATGVGSQTLTNFQNLIGSAYADNLTGDSGANVIDGGGGNDTLNGGGGVNTVSFASAGSGVTVSLLLQGAAQATGVGSDTLGNFQNLTGSAFADTLTGDAGANVIFGGVGNDLIDGHGGADALDGGTGVNTVSFASAGAGVTVSLALQGSAQATGAGSATLSHFQNLTGSGFADTLTGDAGANVIVGGGGADAINGGGGADTLTGGAGADTFAFAPGQTGASVITDFSVGEGDKIDLTAFRAVHGLAGLAGHIAQSGPDTVITLDTRSVTLSGVTAGSLTAAQFLFAPAGSIPVAPADFNHDGLSDILVRDSTTGDFGYMALSPLGGSGWQAVGASNPSYGVFAVADFNGDGASDMLLRNDTTGDVGFMDMTPGGGPVWHDIGGSAVSYTVQGTGDFNGDHVTDMLWRNDTTGDVGYTALTSSGGAGWVHLGNSSTAYTVEGTGDFNGDGVSDLLFRNDSTGDVGYTALTPTGGARWVYLGGSATAYAVQGSGDFNGDGVSDLLFRNQTTGDYGYTALTRSGGASWHALGVSDPTYTIVATGDFNGDGMADVLQRNTATGDYGYMATTSAAGVWHDVGVTDAAHFII